MVIRRDPLPLVVLRRTRRALCFSTASALNGVHGGEEILSYGGGGEQKKLMGTLTKKGGCRIWGQLAAKRRTIREEAKNVPQQDYITPGL